VASRLCDRSAVQAAGFFRTDIILDPQDVGEYDASSSINMTHEAANADIDMRHRFVASALYFLEQTFLDSFAQTLANVWNVSGTVTEQTGS
jgi:hypothetical protein